MMDLASLVCEARATVKDVHGIAVRIEAVLP